MAKRSTAPQEQEALLALPFDHYTRYALTRSILGELRDGSGNLRILDVGGHSSPLKHFLPDDYVVLSDIEPVGSLTSLEFRFDEYVRASGAALPFADGTFDVVAAHDTLEHVPPAFRLDFLAELLRVSSRWVLIGGPMQDAAVTEAEDRVRTFVRSVMHWDQPFLEEHGSLGLPETALVEDLLSERGLKYVAIPNGNLSRWLFMMGLMHYFAALGGSESLRRELDVAYNREIAPHDRDGVCYRRCYVVAKDKADKATMKRLADASSAPSAAEESPARALSGLLSTLESHSLHLQANEKAMHERLYAAESEIFELRAHRDELLEKIHSMDEKAHEMDEHHRRQEKDLRKRVKAAESTIGFRAQSKAEHAWRRITGK